MRNDRKNLLTFLAKKRFSQLPVATIEDVIEELYNWHMPTGTIVSNKVNELSTKYHLPKRFFFWLEANYLNLEVASREEDGENEDEDIRGV